MANMAMGECSSPKSRAHREKDAAWQPHHTTGSHISIELLWILIPRNRDFHRKSIYIYIIYIYVTFS